MAANKRSIQAGGFTFFVPPATATGSNSEQERNND
jgi:hypothetical protein